MQNNLKENKLFGLIIFLLIYIISYVIAYFSSNFINNLILKVFLMDIIATIIIWLISLFIKNSSLYDAYWSLTPMVMLIYLLIINTNPLNVFHYIFIISFLLWSIRLTINWIITFDNIKWEDWRYKKLRLLKKPLWHIANFFGIMMIPTLFVFMGFVPIFYIININLNAFSILGSLIVFIGFLLQLFADHQMHKFLKNNKERKVCQIGLWKYSRHPNYLGEILIWVGTYLTLLLSDLSKWYLFAGVLLMIFLFNVISIPMMEKRQIERRKDYKEYILSTHRLLILPKKHIK